jgi:hypothetical protein
MQNSILRTWLYRNVTSDGDWSDPWSAGNRSPWHGRRCYACHRLPGSDGLPGRTRPGVIPVLVPRARLELGEHGGLA